MNNLIRITNLIVCSAPCWSKTFNKDYKYDTHWNFLKIIYRSWADLGVGGLSEFGKMGCKYSKIKSHIRILQLNNIRYVLLLSQSDISVGRCYWLILALVHIYCRYENFFLWTGHNADCFYYVLIFIQFSPYLYGYSAFIFILVKCLISTFEGSLQKNKCLCICPIFCILYCV